MEFRKFLFFIGFFSFTIALQAESNKPSVQEIQQYAFMQQNRPNFGLENPLKDFAAFNVFLMYPAGTKGRFEKIGFLIKKEFEKIGIVKKLELIAKNKEGEEGLDLSPFDIDSSLIYDIRNLNSIDGKNTGVVRASLNFKSRVNIVKTKQEMGVYLWASNCFLKGNTEKNLEKLVIESLVYLLKDFSDSYNSVNSNKPIFNIVSP